MRKYKATGCARFFIVLIFLAPLAYVGASLYNGQNPVDNIKELLGMNDSPSSSDENTLVLDPEDNSEPARTPPPADLQAEEKIGDLTTENATLTKENSDLKQEITDLKERVKTLEGQIDALKVAVDTTGG